MSNKTTIPIPKGLEIPQGTKENDTLSFLCDFRLEGKNLCLTNIEGNAVEGYKENSKSEFEEKYESEAPKYA